MMSSSSPSLTSATHTKPTHKTSDYVMEKTETPKSLFESLLIAAAVLAVEAAQHHRGVKKVFSGCASGIAARLVSSSTIAEDALVSTRSLRTHEPRSDLDCHRHMPLRLREVVGAHR